MDALLPCPICGCADIELRRSRGYGTGANLGKYHHSALCKGCGAHMPWVLTEEEAVAAWNRRDKNSAKNTPI